jgi:hypothetical protein
LEREPGTSTVVGQAAGTATRRCGHCGEENAADATFCAACHALLAAYDAPAGAQPSDDLSGPPADADEEVPPPPDAPAAPLPEPIAAERVQTQEIETQTEPVTEAPIDPEPGVPKVIEVELAPEELSGGVEQVESADTPVLDDRGTATVPIVAVPPPSVESELAEAPAPEPASGPAVVGGERASRNGGLPLPVPVADSAAVITPAPAVVAPRKAARVQPARPGRLARTSPATIMTAGVALWLVACALIGVAEAAVEVGVVGGAGLAIGAVALYVVAVGLIQAIVRRGDLP